MRYSGCMSNFLRRFSKKIDKDYSSVFLGVGVIIFLVSSLVVVTMSVSESQDLRQQAATCSESPVNVEFRLSTSVETSWKAGSVFRPAVGDMIDINCFSRDGRSLLTNGRMDGFIDNVKFLSARPTEIRNLTLTKGGTYKFSCSNGAGCTNTDTFTVSGGAQPSTSPSPAASQSPKLCPSPVPNGCYCQQVQCVQAPCDAVVICPSAIPAVSPSPSPSPTGCSTNFTSDLNKDCKVTVQDYNLFLEDFRTNVTSN